MRIDVIHEKLKQEFSKGHQVSDSAVQRFREFLPNILALVNEKFKLEASYAGNEEILKNLAFLMDAHRHFGEMLLAVYQFQLWHNLIDEAAWYAQSVRSRGLDERYLSRMLKAWIMAVHSYIRPPEVNELVQPVAWLSRYTQILFQIEGKEADLSDKAYQLLYLLFSNEKDKAAGLVYSFFNEQNSDEAVINKLFIPVLSEIGSLWQKNRMSVADEHLAVANLRAIYQLFFESKSSEKKNQKIAVCCVPGEEHEIGAELLSLYLKSKGWPVIFVGHSTPEAEILRMLDKNVPYVVILSITLLSHLPALKSLAQKIRNEFPLIKILAGGGVLRQLNELVREFADAVPGSFEECHRILVDMVKDA